MDHVTHLDTEAGLIRRIRADNPSPLTGTGTNTYVIGQGDVSVIDPGPNLPSHLAAITAALDPGEHIASILVTHSHLDHSALVPALKAESNAPVFAFGDSKSGRSPHLVGLAELGGGEGVDHQFDPDHIVGHDSHVEIEHQSVRAYWTPGHFGNHMCFEWGDTLFTGDLVMGWSTSLVSPPDGDLTAFMASLENLQTKPHGLYLPGHGPEVTTPLERLDELLTHRRMRENQILDRLADGPQTAADLTATIYVDVPRQLHPAAERNVLSHLIDLTQKKKTRHQGNLTQTTVFSLS